MDLQEANLRSVKVDSDNPLYLSTHSDNSLPSFAAAPGATGSIVNHIGDESKDDIGSSRPEGPGF